MNRKLKNLVVLALFLVILFVSTFTGAFGHQYEWPQLDKDQGNFHGLIFDAPTNVSNLNVVRSIDQNEKDPLVCYDIQFTYAGDNSNMRILGVPNRHVYLPEGVQAHRSNVTLKGEYDKINQNLFEKLSTNNLLKKEGISSFKAISQMRVPLSSKVADYAFTVYEKPIPLYSRNYDKLADLSVFITNARMDRFTDSNIAKKGSSLKVNTKADSQAGTYVNHLERIDEGKLNNISLRKNICTVLFIVSLIASALFIWLDKNKLFYGAMIFMMIMIPSFYPLMDVGVSTLAMLLLYPLLAFIAALASKLMHYDQVKLTTNDLKQSFAFTIVFFILNMVIFILPRAF
ncbi:Uncharacterised protein [Urinicoccus massiliensis]|uniref:Uncharacterized protein n=1 Tax=Urinicoccus massiliensis TaxID=1723382 RepID=A0A8H2QRV5_9FIRM|nr:hypothetical protein [Urinicoccus massiliensis]VFB16241.1 Uncharacterised protein [Urinicoccus massiliensis]